jgi:hypothetical protein
VHLFLRAVKSVSTVIVGADRDHRHEVGGRHLLCPRIVVARVDRALHVSGCIELTSNSSTIRRRPANVDAGIGPARSVSRRAGARCRSSRTLLSSPSAARSSAPRRRRRYRRSAGKVKVFDPWRLAVFEHREVGGGQNPSRYCRTRRGR